MILKGETIKQSTERTLKNGWWTTTRLIMELGASSADRERRRFQTERRKNKNGHWEYHIPTEGQLNLGGM